MELPWPSLFLEQHLRRHKPAYRFILQCTRRRSGPRAVANKSCQRWRCCAFRLGMAWRCAWTCAPMPPLRLFHCVMLCCKLTPAWNLTTGEKLKKWKTYYFKHRGKSGYASLPKFPRLSLFELLANHERSFLEKSLQRGDRALGATIPWKYLRLWCSNNALYDGLPYPELCRSIRPQRSVPSALTLTSSGRCRTRTTMCFYATLQQWCPVALV